MGIIRVNRFLTGALYRGHWIFSAVIFTFLLALLTACNNTAEQEPFVFIPDDTTLRIYIDVYDKANKYAGSFDILNKRVWEAGFNIVFKMYERDEYYYRIDYRIDPNGRVVPNYPSYEEYLLEYRKFVESSLWGNSIFIIDSRYQEFIDNLYYDGKLGDHFELGALLAPDYIREPQTARYNRLSNGEIYSIPLFLEEPHTGTLAILLREDTANEWGGEIRTGSQFEEFLTWHFDNRVKKLAADRTYQGRPCLIPATLGDYWTYNMYLPEIGYMPAGIEHSEYFVLDFNSNSIVPVYELGVFTEVINKKRELTNRLLIHQSGFVGFGGVYHLEPVELYDVALFFLDDYYDLYFAEYTGGSSTIDHFPPAFDEHIYFKRKLNYTNLRDYRMYILYNDSLPEIIWGRGVNDAAYQQAISGHEADISEFLRLLQWLYNQENYIKLFYGNLNEDYTMEGGRITLKEYGESAHYYWQLLSIFRRAEFMPVLNTAPSNFEAEMAAFRNTYQIIISDDDSRLLSEILDSGADLENVLLYFGNAFDNAVIKYPGQP